MIKIIIKEPNKIFEIKDFLDGFYKTDIDKLLNCDWTDKVILSQDLIMYVDDLALHKKLPSNFKIKTTNARFPIQEIRGTVVVVRRKRNDEDYDFITLTDEDVHIFENILIESKHL